MSRVNPSIRGLAVAVIALAAAGAAGAEVRYRGMCDASAAVAIGKGHFIVADDESDVLRVYRRERAAPVAAVDLSDYLRNRDPDGKMHEADIEGAAAIGGRIYWIGSHARKGGDGSVDKHRWRLFATDVVAGAAVPTVKPLTTPPYQTLLADIVADARFGVLAEAAAIGPEQPGGLNIEGLADTPEGGLLIGFRNPLPRGRALALPLRNPAQLLSGAARPAFGDLIRLDLGGRGIRSIERVGNAYLISAGPPGPASASRVKPAFALFRWAGSAQAAPVLVRALDGGSFRPEAMFHDPQANDLYLLSDDGDERVGGRDCKTRRCPQTKSRSARWRCRCLDDRSAGPTSLAGSWMPAKA